MTHQKNYIFEITLPETLSVKKHHNFLFFSGPLGSSALNLEKIDPFGTNAIFLEERHLKIITSSKPFHGLVKKLIQNKIQGVTRGFLIYLKIIGIGYRAHLDKNTLLLKLGYSHDILYNLPSSVKVFLLDPTLVCLFGIDKDQLTQIASKLRNFRKPSVYKGKGIRLLNEKVRMKTGKRK